MADSDSSGCGWIVVTVILIGVCFGSQDDGVTGRVWQGDLSPEGGSPTVRREFEPQPDDPYTTNDESNDQPVGYFGTKTLSIAGQNGNMYILDGELEGTELSRVYFPRGGWVDFLGCELDTDLSGFCIDEQGRPWTIHGEAFGYSSPAVEEEEESYLDGDEDVDDEDGDEDYEQ